MASKIEPTEILARFLEQTIPHCDESAQSLPRISVVIPSYNQGKFLERCLISLFNQNYPNLEILIYDGGSTDNTVEIIGRFEARITYWQSCPDGGQANALKSAFERATGDYFCWQNSDDLFFPGCLLALGHEAVRSNAKLLCGNLYLCDAEERVFEEVRYAPVCRADLPYIRATITNQAAIFASDLYRASGGFDASFSYCLDLDLWDRMLRLEACSRMVPRAYGVYRCHGQSKTSLLANTHAAERNTIAVRTTGELNAFAKAKAKVNSRMRKAVYHLLAGDIDYLLSKFKVRSGLTEQRDWT